MPLCPVPYALPTMYVFLVHTVPAVLTPILVPSATIYLPIPLLVYGLPCICAHGSGII